MSLTHDESRNFCRSLSMASRSGPKTHANRCNCGRGDSMEVTDQASRRKHGPACSEGVSADVAGHGTTCTRSSDQKFRNKGPRTTSRVHLGSTCMITRSDSRLHTDTDRSCLRRDAHDGTHAKHVPRRSDQGRGCASRVWKSHQTRCKDGCSRQDEHSRHDSSHMSRSYQSQPRTVKKIILIESTAPQDCSVKLVRIPADLMWKFNKPDKRYWVKLNEEESRKYKPHLGIGIREHCGVKHYENIAKFKENLEHILRDQVAKHKFKFWCEARLGRLAWRASESDLLNLNEVCMPKDKEFYTRTTTKVDDMIEKFKSHCLPIDMNLRDNVTLQVKDINNKKTQYRVILDEYPPGRFTMNRAEGCIHAKGPPTNKAEFVCIGRIHDLRIASDCQRYTRMHKPVPPAAEEAIDKIAKSVQRTETGQLKMMLLSGCVEVEHVRQKKTRNFFTKDHFGVNFYELKETKVPSSLSPMEDEIVTLKHHSNQEIEVEMTKEISSQEMIPEILGIVEKLVDFALDVVDMAEECRDPDIPY